MSRLFFCHVTGLPDTCRSSWLSVKQHTEVLEMFWVLLVRTAAKVERPAMLVSSRSTTGTHNNSNTDGGKQGVSGNIEKTSDGGVPPLHRVKVSQMVGVFSVLFLIHLLEVLITHSCCKTLEPARQTRTHTYVQTAAAVELYDARPIVAAAEHARK